MIQRHTGVIDASQATLAAKLGGWGATGCRKGDPLLENSDLSGGQQPTDATHSRVGTSSHVPTLKL